MIEKTGVISKKELKKHINLRIPSEERLNKGSCVVVECFQEIPCDPCKDACPYGAIKIEGNINNLPIVDFSKCNGCGVCISSCPGLAIFVVNKNYEKDYGLVMLPYELLPLPKKGDVVDGLSRYGKKICKAIVEKILLTKRQNKTAIISIKIPQKLIMEVRSIRVKKY